MRYWRQGTTEHGTEEHEEATVEEREEWPRIPVEDYFEEGYYPYKRVKGLRSYITLKKGRREKSLGVYTPERWERINTLYQQSQPAEAAPTGRKTEDDVIMSALRGRVRGEGYLGELKDMIRRQISLSREFTVACTNAGVQIVFAALKKGGVSQDEISRISTDVGALKNVVDKATESALKALEYYDVERIEGLERERDEARVAWALVVAQAKKFAKYMEPKAGLERMIHTYLLSGRRVDPNIMAVLVEKWLSIEVTKVLKSIRNLGHVQT